MAQRRFHGQSHARRRRADSFPFLIACKHYSEKSPQATELLSFLSRQVNFPANLSQGTSMQKWSQPLIWGMVIAVIGPIMASFFGLAFTYLER
jgi:hypothetical protein